MNPTTPPTPPSPLSPPTRWRVWHSCGSRLRSLPHRHSERLLRRRNERTLHLCGSETLTLPLQIYLVFIFIYIMRRGTHHDPVMTPICILLLHHFETEFGIETDIALLLRCEHCGELDVARAATLCQWVPLRVMDLSGIQ